MDAQCNLSRQAHTLSAAARMYHRSMALVELESVSKSYPRRTGLRTEQQLVVREASFAIEPGETLGLVGESGSGKSTVARMILGLVQPTSGVVRVDGLDLAQATRVEMRRLRRQMQPVFQDPFAALNPRMRVFDIVTEPWRIHSDDAQSPRGAEAVRAAAVELLRSVGLEESALERYPHEFSGGQRQRICIARALALNPKVVIADESVSALDVSIQAQIINLLMDLQKELGIAFLFISHDMAVVERISHRVAVMYLGQIVEIGPRAAVFENPQHAYTRKLMAAVPVANPLHKRVEQPLLVDEVPSPIRPLGNEPIIAPLVKVSEGHFVARHTIAGVY